jgi:hypothetical protein
VEPLSFGIFPLGLAGSADGVASGPPDDFEQVAAAAAELQGDGPPIMPRMYVNWTGPVSTEAVLRQVGEYAALGLPWDMVLCYRDSSGSVPEWVSFVSQVVAGHGHELAPSKPGSPASNRHRPRPRPHPPHPGRRGPRRHRTAGASGRLLPDRWNIGRPITGRQQADMRFGG